MRIFILALLVLLSGSAGAVMVCADKASGDPAAQDNPPYMPPIVPDTGIGIMHYQAGGPASCPTFNSPGSPTNAGGACAAFCAGFGCGTDGHPKTCGGYAAWLPIAGSNNLDSRCICENGGGNVLGQGVCGNQMPLGYKQWNSWKSIAADDAEQDIAATSGVVLRNADGNITSLQVPNDSGGFNTWTANTWDSANRVTSVTFPDASNVTYTYHPGTSEVYSRSDAVGTTRYLWETEVQPYMIQTPDGTNFQFKYSADSAGNKHLDQLTVQPTAAPPADGSKPFLSAGPLNGQIQISYGTSPGTAIPVFPDQNPTLPMPEPLQGGCVDPVEFFSGGGGNCEKVARFCMSQADGPSWGVPVNRADLARKLIMISRCRLRYGCGPY